MNTVERIHACRLVVWAHHNIITLTALSIWGIINCCVTVVNC